MKIVLGISGASGAIYGIRLLRELKKAGVHVSLIVTQSGVDVIGTETSTTMSELKGFADRTYDPDDLSAPPASGSHRFDCMVICPCSMSTLSKIATGISDCLLTRSAAVCLKEGRKLVLVPRETPLSAIYLRNMTTLAESGAIILPPSPAFYHAPESVSDLVDFIVGKVLDSLGLEHDLFRRWGSKSEKKWGSKSE